MERSWHLVTTQVDVSCFDEGKEKRHFHLHISFDLLPFSLQSSVFWGDASKSIKLYRYIVYTVHLVYIQLSWQWCLCDNQWTSISALPTFATSPPAVSLPLHMEDYRRPCRGCLRLCQWKLHRGAVPSSGFCCFSAMCIPGVNFYIIEYNMVFSWLFDILWRISHRPTSIASTHAVPCSAMQLVKHL